MRWSERAPAADPRSLSLPPFPYKQRARSVPVAHLVLVRPMRPLIAFGLLLAASASGFAVEQTYDGGFEPKPPSPFPAAYQDYQILPNTISPDHQYAFIYPKRSRLYELPDPVLYLAALEPFRVL